SMRLASISRIPFRASSTSNACPDGDGDGVGVGFAPLRRRLERPVGEGEGEGPTFMAGRIEFKATRFDSDSMTALKRPGSVDSLWNFSISSFIVTVRPGAFAGRG